MRTLIIVLIVIAFLVLMAIGSAQLATDRVTFNKPKLVGADLKSVLSGSTTTSVDLTETIDNRNGFSIPVSGLYFEVYYNNSIVAKSDAPHDNFTIPARGSITVSQNVQLDLTNVLNIVQNIILGQPVQFDYMVKGKLFGFFPFTYNGNFTYPS